MLGAGSTVAVASERPDGQGREFRFGHVRQLDAVASRTLVNLADEIPLLQVPDGEWVMVDLDDTIIAVHGYKKQGASFGYFGVRGLNALLAAASTTSSAPVFLAQRLRQGKTGSPKGAARIVGDSLATLRRMRPASCARPLVRADSAFYGHATIGTAIKAGADVSVTVRMDPAVKAAIASIPENAWEMIEYTDSIRDEVTGQWIPKAEVAEVPFVAFRSRKKAEQVEGRLVVRRIPELNPQRTDEPTPFDTYRHHRQRLPDYRRDHGATESEVDDRDARPETRPCPRPVKPHRSR